MQDPRSARLNGLDTLRALAVTLVVLHHYTLFVSNDDATFGWVGRIGWAGVDLFFALSGYLIGNQIFKAMATDAGLSLRAFYARRLLRTLPNYLVVLALYVLWPAWGENAPLAPLLRYLSFTQNLGLKPGTAFSHSWSLAIEEQFYLLLPALALLGAALRGRIVFAWVFIACVVVGGMLLRAQLWAAQVDGQTYGTYFYYKLIYYASLCRLDELVAGVALALLKNRHPDVWTRATRHGNGLLAAGLLVTGLAFWLFLDDRYGFAPTVFGFSLLGLAFGLLILAALSERSLLRDLRIPGAGRLAVWSYAIYLTHRGACAVAYKPLQALGYGPQTMVAIGLLLALSVLSGWILYRLVETPFMALRERYVPSNLVQAMTLR
ncbi:MULTISPECIES: acyltransferase [unclassified Massilia]|uniref:acyltransferase family protein n=1 Tax=unclassified Massilia TaxID=2609279 RepID=UPI0017861399|nr:MULTISPECIES: acyltransferase [unclassified Massilia]MBD8532324.1 acyltransferase [Massilia sp. CFBP 13647]MBD8673803.1 acyltransferase [Massilia sp. CFBP 13721]